MNKEGFIKTLAEQTGYDEEKCTLINAIVEDTFIIGKKNKEKMIEKFITNLNMEDEEARKLYDTVMGIVGTGIKNRLKHPFGEQ